MVINVLKNYMDVAPRSPRKFLRALRDVVREQGAMKRLLVNSANVKCSDKVIDYLGMLVIKFW